MYRQASVPPYGFDFFGIPYKLTLNVVFYYCPGLPVYLRQPLYLLKFPDNFFYRIKIEIISPLVPNDIRDRQECPPASAKLLKNVEVKWGRARILIFEKETRKKEPGCVTQIHRQIFVTTKYTKNTKK
jgi:hypothetical protein